MKHLKKLTLTLVALLAVTTGAWADDYFYIVISGTSGTLKYGSEYTSADPYLDLNKGSWRGGGSKYWNDMEYLTAVTIDASCNNYNGTSLNNLFSDFSGLTTINGLENLNTANVQDMENMFSGCSSLTSLDLSSFNTASVTTIYNMFNGCSKLTSLDLSSWNTENVKKINSMFFYCSELTTVDLSGWNTAKVLNTSYMFYKCSKLENIYVGDGWSTAAVTMSDDMFTGCTKLLSMNTANPATNITNAHTGDGGYLKVKPAPASGPDVTINDAKSEASFKMPQYDVTVSYTIKRDMTVDVAGEMADRIRIQMVDNAFQAVDATQMNLVVKDNLDAENPVTLTETTDYTLQLQKQNETDATVWDDVTALSVGNFRYKITGAGNYSGVAYSDEFALFQGYEIEIAAGEFVTYFKDEALYVEDTDAKLYTITAVSDETATAEQLNIAAANTPLLVKNNATVTKTILLIPTEQTADDVTPYSGFTGTLVDAEVPASTDEQNNYALNGNEFIWVKDAVSIAANHAWLQVPASGAQQARTLTIVFSDATAIGAVSKTGTDDNSWYDLNGRKLDKKPTRKGVYIQNGRKVVIK